MRYPERNYLLAEEPSRFESQNRVFRHITTFLFLVPVLDTQAAFGELALDSFPFTLICRAVYSSTYRRVLYIEPILVASSSLLYSPVLKEYTISFPSQPSLFVSILCMSALTEPGLLRSACLDSQATASHPVHRSVPD